MMKKMSFWQRLRTSLAVLILLLIIGAGLAWWVERTRSTIEHRSDQLENDAANVRLKVVEMGDALRGLLLDPKNVSDRKLGADAEKDLEHNLDALRSRYNDNERLLKSIKNVREFAGGTNAIFQSYQTKLTDLQETDAAAAIAQYAKTYDSTIRARRNLVLNEFEGSVQTIRNADLSIIDQVSFWGFISLVLILFISVFIGGYQTSAVTKPLAQLVEALERMRHGDFTKRLSSPLSGAMNSAFWAMA